MTNTRSFTETDDPVVADEEQKAEDDEVGSGSVV
jgi:hypothetical protein